MFAGNDDAVAKTWSVFDNGNSNVQALVMDDLLAVRQKVENEVNNVFDVSEVSDEAKGRRLMMLLQQDLIPGMSGKILEEKSKKDYHFPPPVSAGVKALGWVLIIGINTALLLYVYLFAMSQTGSAQDAWFQSFIIWFCMDVLLVGTGMVYITQFLVPSFTMKEIQKIRSKMLDTLERHRMMVSGLEKEEAKDDQSAFNAADYLFVSSRVAKLYPQLRESEIILKYLSPWPRQSYLHTQKQEGYNDSKFSIVSRFFGVILVYIISGILETSYLHDLFNDVIVRSITGVVVLGHIDLYELNPLLVVVPLLFVVIVVHFLIYSDTNDLLEKLKKNDYDRKMRISPKFTDTFSAENSTHVRAVDSDYDDEDDEEDSSSDGFVYESVEESVSEYNVLAMPSANDNTEDSGDNSVSDSSCVDESSEDEIECSSASSQDSSQDADGFDLHFVESSEESNSLDSSVLKFDSSSSIAP